VTEYMAGGSLRSRMRPGVPWPLDQALPVLEDVADALEHIHERGILHLDLKPENVLYTADGQVKIADFGLSVTGADARPTTGEFRGTLDYAAPEHLTGSAPDARYDVFSLTTLAYELLTGRIPGRVFVPASQRNRALPKAFDGVLQRGLAREPAERYPSVAEFRQALAGACRSTARRFPVRVLVALTGLVIVAGVLLALGSWRRSAPQPEVPRLPDEPTRLWLLYDKPEDMSLLAGDSGELASDSDARIERVRIENPSDNVPPDLPVPFWPSRVRFSSSARNGRGDSSIRFGIAPSDSVCCETGRRFCATALQRKKPREGRWVRRRLSGDKSPL